MDNHYIFAADLLNKFSQLTPWVQAIIGLGFFAALIGFCYFFKETVRVITSPFKRDNHRRKQEAEDIA